MGTIPKENLLTRQLAKTESFDIDNFAVIEMAKNINQSENKKKLRLNYTY
jgi:hypothetical protein